MAEKRAVKKLNDAEISKTFRDLVARISEISQRKVTWTEVKSVRVSSQYWENSLDSKYTDQLVEHERVGYFLADQEVSAESVYRLNTLIEAYAEAPELIVRLRQAENALGWEWIDHMGLRAMYGDRLSDLAPQARVELERALGELSLGLGEAVSTARWRLGQVEPHLVTLAALKEREIAGFVPFFGGWLHTSGSNGRARYWVMRQDGTLRAHDRDEYSRSHRRGVHTQWWELVEPGELGLRWTKNSNAAEHVFEVLKLPQGGECTQAQLETIARLEAEIESEWAGRRGLASGCHSPAVGAGWGLFKQPGPETDSDSPFAVLKRLKGK